MAGVSLIKAIIGTSLPAKPTNHLLPAARPSPWERYSRGTQPRGKPACAEMPGWELVTEVHVSQTECGRNVGAAGEGSSSWETS